MSQYPKYKYHSKHPARVVSNSVEEGQLGHGWIDTPVQAKNEEVGQGPMGHYISPEEQKERDNAHARVLLENQKLREELAKRDAQKPEPQPEQEAKPEGELEEPEEETEESDSDSDEGFEEEPFEEPEQEEQEAQPEGELEEPAEDEKPKGIFGRKKKSKKKSGR